MSKFKPTLALTIFLAISPASNSQSQTEIKPILIAKQNIDVFQKPRHGLFCNRGGKLGQVRTGDEIADYEEVTSFCGLMFKNMYLKIKVHRADGRLDIGYVRSADDAGRARFAQRGENHE